MDLIKNNFSVIIVGAGMAGLGACRTLIDAGCTDILLIEGQEKPGGRVQSIKVDLSNKSSTLDDENVWLELGAQWMHGQENQLYDIANFNNLLADVTSSEGLGQYLRGDGEEIETSLVAEVSDVMGNLLESCETFWTDNDNKNVPLSVGHYLRKKFEEYLEECNDPIEIKIKKLELYDWHVRFQIIDNSCNNLDELSAKSWGRYKFCGGEDYINFKEGYSSLVNRLVDDLPEGILKLNTTVTKVNYNTNNYINNIKNGFIIENNGHNDVIPSSSPIIVTCDDGYIYKCQHIIITSSLGYLKKNHLTMFNPPLPDRLIKCIEGIGFAAINKIFLCYKKPWWNSNQHGFQIIWNSNEKSKCMSLQQNQTWMKDISGFDVLCNLNGVLLGWVGRQGAVEVEKLTEKEISEHCTKLLRHFTGNKSIPYPDKVVRSQWHSNSLICGGYSHLTTKCDLLGINEKNSIRIKNKIDDKFSDPSPENLSHPIYLSTHTTIKKPAILFAGEATHEKYFSTTHGAFLSGQKQAKVILKYINEIKMKSKKLLSGHKYK